VDRKSSRTDGRNDERCPLVSIVIPAFVGSPSQAELLDQTLSTVSAQTCSDYEIIVVDDGSPIDITDIALRWARTIVVRQRNAGPAAARNTGIARSRGRFLIFLDADDHLLPAAVEAGAAALDAHPDCGFAVGPREEMTFEGAPVPWDVPPPPRQTDLYLPLLGFEWYIIPPSSAMFRRELVESIGGFRDPWGADDLDFYLRAARRYRAWCYQSPAITRYRRYSASSSRDGERMLRSVRIVYARQWPLVQGDPEAESAFHAGLNRLTDIFLDCLAENVVDRLRAGNREHAARSARLLARESPDRWRMLLSSTASWAPPGDRDGSAPGRQLLDEMVHVEFEAREGDEAEAYLQQLAEPQRKPGAGRRDRIERVE
jgi:glycosyltransferase involved in cell wall biosynthesis